MLAHRLGIERSGEVELDGGEVEGGDFLAGFGDGGDCRVWWGGEGGAAVADVEPQSF